MLPNLQFEYELARRPIPRAVTRQNERFSHILRLVPGFRDAAPLAELSQPDEVAAWGWSEQAAAVAGRASHDWPAAELVRHVNDKRTSHQIEQELGIALPGATIVGSLEEFEAAVERIGQPWVAKDPFGVAGRGQVKGTFPVDEMGAAAVSRLLSETSEIVLEPFVLVEKEYSLHWDVNREHVEYRGAATLLTDNGTFRGNAVPTDVPAAIVNESKAAAEKIGALGWCGPIGIDAFSGRLSGRRLLRSVCEINARWSFGRLTLELADLLSADNLRWMHPARGVQSPARTPVEDGAAPGLWRLPSWCDPRGKSETWLEIG